MGNSVQTERVLRFLDFQVNLNTGEVRKAEVRLKLQDQPFKVLATLVQRPGQVVTREDLRQLIWPEESFGDFDHAINLAVTKLRSALGDSADVPHLIETLPRRGYRFIAPIEGHIPSDAEAQPAAQRDFKGLPTKWTWFVVGATLLVLGSALAFVRLLRKSAEAPPSAVEVIPLVSMPGQQAAAAISPDGKQIAFAEFGQRQGIYITLVNGGKSLQLTQNNDSYPTWSPDGSQIAFARYSGSQESFYIMRALGGSEHRVYTAPVAIWQNCGRLDWSPDGKFLVFPESIDDGTRSRLTMLSLSDLIARPFTLPSNQQFDCEPTFSPDGASVAFVCGSMRAFLGDLFVVKVAGGDPVRLTSANSGGAPAWTPDGREIVFSSRARAVLDRIINS